MIWLILFLISCAINIVSILFVSKVYKEYAIVLSYNKEIFKIIDSVKEKIVELAFVLPIKSNTKFKEVYDNLLTLQNVFEEYEEFLLQLSDVPKEAIITENIEGISHKDSFENIMEKLYDA